MRTRISCPVPSHPGLALGWDQIFMGWDRMGSNLQESGWNGTKSSFCEMEDPDPDVKSGWDRMGSYLCDGMEYPVPIPAGTGTGPDFHGWDGTRPDFCEMGQDRISHRINPRGMGPEIYLWDEMGPDLWGMGYPDPCLAWAHPGPTASLVLKLFHTWS